MSDNKDRDLRRHLSIAAIELLESTSGPVGVNDFLKAQYGLASDRELLDWLDQKADEIRDDVEQREMEEEEDDDPEAIR